MSDLTTEAQAEDVLLGAILGSDDDEPPPEAELNQPQNLDETETEEGERQQEPAQTESAAPEEDMVEIPGEEGREPTRIALKDVLAGYQEFKALEAQKGEIIERTQREATEQVTQSYRQVEQYAQRVAANIYAALQVLQPPQPPSAEELLNPASPKYDPDAYHRAFAHFQQNSGRFQQAQGVANQLLQQAQHASEQATEQRETLELEKLERVWPGFSKTEAINQFISDMGKAYGYSPQELDASLNDHRNALVARDALAYRKLMAKSGDVKAKVETAAPKLVRSKHEAKGSVTQARDAGGKFVGDAKTRAMKSRSDEDWAGYFAGLSKAGRI